MKIQLIQSAVLAMVLSVSVSCSKNETPQSLTFAQPDNWPSAKYNFENNPITKEGFELGKKLFFDPILSRGNQVSCGTCHQPFAAFSQLDHDLSHGVDDLLGIRNSPGLFNLAWHDNFFWDGGVNHIELQPINPIQNPVEMDESLTNIIAKLNSHPEYPTLFLKAFGTKEISTASIMKALTQFQGLLVSNNAKYDKVREGVLQFSAEEEQGYQIFQTNCATCHTEPLFSSFDFKNNGLPIVPLLSGFVDSGRGHITPLEPSSYFQFKIPSLRNLSYTAPYMHNGKIKTIEQVIEHYTQIDTSATYLSSELRRKIVLNTTEKKALIAFLKTLDDPSFVNNPLFQEK